MRGNTVLFQSALFPRVGSVFPESHDIRLFTRSAIAVVVRACRSYMLFSDGYHCEGFRFLYSLDNTERCKSEVFGTRRKK
jgi:hypothetical protein